MRSAMCASSQLPGRGPTDVDIACVPARYEKSNDDDDDIYKNSLYQQMSGAFWGLWYSEDHPGWWLITVYMCTCGKKAKIKPPLYMKIP